MATSLRTSQEIVKVEYSELTNRRLLSSDIVHVEYADSFNFRRVSQQLIMVEYSTFAPIEFGPSWQVVS